MMMELEIQKEVARPLLKMTEVEARISFEGATPSKHAVVQALAAKKKCKENLVIVHAIRTVYGEQAAIVTARIYENREALELVEQQSLLKKHEAKPAESEEKAAEKPAEAPTKEESEKPTEGEAKGEEKAATSEEKPAEAPEEAKKPAENAAAEEKPAEKVEEKADASGDA